jgi:hypothetical protein
MGELDLSGYIPDEMDLRDAMLAGALAKAFGHADHLMHLLKKWGQDVMLHSTENGWCLHIDYIFGDEHGLEGEDLNHLLLAGLGHVCRHQQHLRNTAKFN